MKIILKINDIDLSSIVIDARTSSKDNGGIIGTTVEADLHCDLEALRYLDLRGRVHLKVIQEGAEYSVFHGLVKDATSQGSTFVLKCQDLTQLLEEAKMGGGFGRGVPIEEIIYYLVTETDSEGTDPRNFYVKKNQTLAETGWITRPRRFVYIAPLPSCTLKAGVDTIKMANCWIYKIGENVSADDRIIAHFASDEPLWESCETRVRFYVQATSFLEALEKGQSRLQRLLDVLSFGASYASATYPTTFGPRLFQYERARNSVVIQETEWAFLRDTASADRYWMHWDAPRRHLEPFSVTQDDPILSLYEVFQDIIEEDDKGLSGKERAMLNALHALRQVRESTDTKDALDHVWRCMEFLLAGYATEPLFSDDERKAIILAAEKILEVRQAEHPSHNHKEQKQRLQSIVSHQLNQVTLRSKWQLFCMSHGLTFPKPDEDFLWRLRRNRNHHQHGRSTTVSRHDIDRAATMMEKAVVAAAVNPILDFSP